jgi:NhaA family Na+:H+ antiporter
LNHGKEGASGWGIPMATDIAFALGALALLGSRIPAPLKIFVAALAIADDIVAVGVIAFFYTAEISFVHLGLGLAGIAVSAGANWAGVRKPIIYAFLFAFVWVAMLKSGVHATIAGVLMAFTIPAKTYIDRPRFLQRCGALLRRLEQAAAGSGEEHEVVHSLEAQCELMQSPLHRIEHKLQPWVTFMVMPLFALANAGVNVVGGSLSRFWNTCTLGIFLGLVLGKPSEFSCFRGFRRSGAWLRARPASRGGRSLGPVGFAALVLRCLYLLQRWGWQKSLCRIQPDSPFWQRLSRPELPGVWFC